MVRGEYRHRETSQKRQGLENIAVVRYTYLVLGRAAGGLGCLEVGQEGGDLR